MVKIAVVGCTGKLGGMIIKEAAARPDIEVVYAIARSGNRYVGHGMAELIGGHSDLIIIDGIEQAKDCDVFIDCTNAAAFIEHNCERYRRAGKPVVIATTAFSEEDMDKIRKMATETPVFLTGNFSVALHDFIETLRFAVRRVSNDTDIQIVEYHHNEKHDAPSGTAIMIRDALTQANGRLTAEDIDICSVRGGNIFGEHEVIFANCKDEVVTFKHSVSSREPFVQGALDVMVWIVKQKNGLYTMDDFCE
ncbi:MAG: 4-hydroxy-tetrahydrodipicolinate reductase [Lachnospiraceae bacterium]|nr:4-hydroxy-tetrahydrodipicolinate reductase [Lachnospiraceae bacterium]